LNRLRASLGALFLLTLNNKKERLMELKDHSDKDLLKSLEAEMAKSLGELRCAQGDLDKISARLKFSLAVIHQIKDKKE
jgi:hypothetical protein